MDIDRLSLSHLRLFDALYRLGSVSKAARDLGIPQSTASRGLNQLRTALDDELFVRSGGRMTPTVTATRQAPIVASILTHSKALISANDKFDPRQDQRTFVIAASDVGQLVTLRKLWPAVTQYPNIQLYCAAFQGDHLGQSLADGAADLAIGAYPRLHGGIKEQTLYRESYACFCLPTHPYANTPTLENFIKSYHSIVTTKGLGHFHRRIEQALLKLIPADKLRMTSSSFLVSLLSVTTDDIIFSAPGLILGEFADRLGLQHCPAPAELESFEVKQYWHERYSDDNAHKWIRSELFSLLSQYKSF